MSKISTQPRSKQAALFGAQLRGWREHRGMTQSEAARALKIDKGYLCRVELGRHKPRPPLLRELIRLYAIGSRGLGNLRGSRWLNQQGGY
jgi:transcriptional regulator with XRE-family HTH domain